MAITSANQLELLQTAEAVAREKMIDPDLVIQAMEDSLARAAKSRYGAEMDIRVSIDRKTGRATFARVRTVVEDELQENHHAQITVKQALAFKADAAIGDEIIDEVPPVDLGRIAAQSAKQVILQKVREAERDRQFEEFKDRKGTIINGQVKREEYGNIIVDIGRGEAILRRNEKIGRESYRPNDRIRAYIKDVRREARGLQVFLSRTDPQFMAELFKMAPRTSSQHDGIFEGHKCEIKCARRWAGKDDCRWQHLEPEHDYTVAMLALLEFHGWKVWCITKAQLMGELREKKVVTFQGKQGWWTLKSAIMPYLTPIRGLECLRKFISTIPK